jgi:hypothetical protein
MLWTSIIQKQFFSNSEGEVEAKTVSFQQQVLLYSKLVFGKFRACACALMATTFFSFQILLYKAT